MSHVTSPHAWLLGLTATAIIAVAFLAVAAALAVSLTSTHQWRNNPLGVGTFMLYLTCGGGHAMHLLQLVEPTLGYATAAGLAARVEYGAWHLGVIDAFTALAGVSYWMLRHRFPALVSGAAVYEDLRDRQRRALAIHDTVVQGLARAKLALEIDRQAEGEEAVEESLRAAKRIITELLGEGGVQPGSLRRDREAA